MKILLTSKLILSYEFMKTADDVYQKINDKLSPLHLKLLIDSKIKVSSSRIAQYPKGTLITKTFNIYLADNKEAQNYCDKRHEININNGYETDPNECPILTSKIKLIDAQNKFIDESLYLVSSTKLKRANINTVEARENYINLASNLIEAIKNRDEKLLDKLYNNFSK